MLTWQHFSTEYSQPQEYSEYYPADGNQEYNYQEERYGQEDEDRQWDSGGTGGDYPIDNSYDNGYDDQCYTTPPETTDSVDHFETDQYKNRLNSARSAKVSSSKTFVLLVMWIYYKLDPLSICMFVLVIFCKRILS